MCRPHLKFAGYCRRFGNLGLPRWSLCPWADHYFPEPQFLPLSNGRFASLARRDLGSGDLGGAQSRAAAHAKLFLGRSGPGIGVLWHPGSGHWGTRMGVGWLTWRPPQSPRAVDDSSRASGPGRSSGRKRVGGAQGAAAPRSQEARGMTRAPTLLEGPSSTSRRAIVSSQEPQLAGPTGAGASESAGGRGRS